MLLLNACGSDISERHAVRRKVLLWLLWPPIGGCEEGKRAVRLSSSSHEEPVGRTMAECLCQVPRRRPVMWRFNPMEKALPPLVALQEAFRQTGARDGSEKSLEEWILIRLLNVRFRLLSAMA
ncbi:hypothetical protein M409DRAFT_50249 [Zasmidium cellare ATCC 36951]|uniref:Uncharacterized protein n=1 Tax=Zasmidium cellare ATCC 36951 TaxID=1080233 RepID=A0A6A6CZB5_ZASCE|nr:uncharacterized protein M409DRAFT_50249 [Zasmidium cellare ATCC 36951]KAF2172577.1 hypothetical protein M409DRAFT_50249 [Zasmidium cellare ATCC 36951]